MVEEIVRTLQHLRRTMDAAEINLEELPEWSPIGKRSPDFYLSPSRSYKGAQYIRRRERDTRRSGTRGAFIKSIGGEASEARLC